MEKVGRIFRESLANTIKEGIKNNETTFLVSYSAVSATRMDVLRKGLKSIGARAYVSKNRIARSVLKELKQEELSKEIEGQTAFVWGGSDAGAVSKVLMKFEKECAGVTVRGGLLDGVLLGKEDVKRLSDLPSREILLAQLLGTIIAPVTRLVGIMNSKSRDLLSILKQLSERKGNSPSVHPEEQSDEGS